MNGERKLLSFKGKALINLAVPRIYQLSSMTQIALAGK